MVWLHVLLCLCFALSAQAHESIALKSRPGAGLFSSFNDVVSALEAYDKGKIIGLEIAFGREGIYYEESYGPNWWCYFCEPIVLGVKTNVREGCHGQVGSLSASDFRERPQEAHRLIQKYIRFQPHVLDKKNRFCQAHFAGSRVIGVHYRGTDWIWENNFPRVPYEVFAHHVRLAAASLGDSACKIFVATDEQPFLEFMREAFPGRICCQEEAYRSRTDRSVHKDPSYDHARQGEEAVLDCLLLAETNAFIGTHSNLSQWVTFLNPRIPAVDLSGKTRF